MLPFPSIRILDYDYEGSNLIYLTQLSKWKAVFQRTQSMEGKRQVQQSLIE